MQDMLGTGGSFSDPFLTGQTPIKHEPTREQEGEQAGQVGGKLAKDLDETEEELDSLLQLLEAALQKLGGASKGEGELQNAGAISPGSKLTPSEQQRLNKALGNLKGIARQAKELELAQADHLVTMLTLGAYSALAGSLHLDTTGVAGGAEAEIQKFAASDAQYQALSKLLKGEPVTIAGLLEIFAQAEKMEHSFENLLKKIQAKVLTQLKEQTTEIAMDLKETEKSLSLVSNAIEAYKALGAEAKHGHISSSDMAKLQSDLAALSQQQGIKSDSKAQADYKVLAGKEFSYDYHMAIFNGVLAHLHVQFQQFADMPKTITEHIHHNFLFFHWTDTKTVANVARTMGMVGTEAEIVGTKLAEHIYQAIALPGLAKAAGKFLSDAMSDTVQQMNFLLDQLQATGMLEDAKSEINVIKKAIHILNELISTLAMAMGNAIFTNADALANMTQSAIAGWLNSGDHTDVLASLSHKQLAAVFKEVISTILELDLTVAMAKKEISDDETAFSSLQKTAHNMLHSHSEQMRKMIRTVVDVMCGNISDEQATLQMGHTKKHIEHIGPGFEQQMAGAIMGVFGSMIQGVADIVATDEDSAFGPMETNTDMD